MFCQKILFVLGVTICCAGVASAQVAPTTLFQLDGNAASTPLSCSYGTCDYWDLLNGSGTTANPGVAGHSSVRTFINGASQTNVFSRGSKDTIDYPGNNFSMSSSPNKDTINAAYAAAYTSGGEFSVMFGGDRASPSGSSFIGIWFLQQSVSAGSNGSFIGAHTDHDVFVISNFAGGGSTSEIQVLEWDHAGCGNIKSAVKNPANGACSDTNLRLLQDATTVCGTSAYCAIANPIPTVTTWEGTLASPLFFEGGIDLTQAFKNVGVTQLPCFTSFLEETRSSFSTSAELKDFVVGGFPVCGVSVTKSCGQPSITAGGTEVNYPVNGLVTNTGVGTLYNVSVFDTPQGGTTGQAIQVSNNVSTSPNFGTSTLGSSETGTWSDSTTTTAASASDTAIAQGALSSSVVPNGNTTQANTVTSSPATQTCNSSFSTALSVTKNCSTSLQVANGAVGVLVSYSGTVYNNGPSQITGVVLKDTPTSGTSATISIGTLAPCNPAVFDANGNCTTAGAFKAYSSSYTPTNIDAVINGVGGPGTGPGRYSWTDAVTITGATATIGTLSPLTSGPYTGTFGGASASCPICQGSGECAP